MMCDKCLPKCATCREGKDLCSTCAGNLILAGADCLESCPVGYYKNGASCALCNINCDTCTGPNSGQCLSCIEKRYVIIYS